jgi:hypothetical protein
MVVGTKRFVVFHVLTFSSLLIWVIWSMKVFQVNFCMPNIKLQVVVGALLIFAEIALLGIKDGKIKDLEFSEFKRITWVYVFDQAFLAIVIAIIIVAAIKIINPVIASLKSDLGNIAVQLVGGLISGAIGFGSAILVYRYQQENFKKKEVRLEIEKLWYEIVHNMLILKGDLDTNTAFFRKLENNCWNAAIASKLPINGRIKGQLLDLYGYFDLYNYVHRIHRDFFFRETTGRAFPEKVKQVENTLPKVLYEEIKNANALLFGEMVEFGYRQEKDWIYYEIGWKKIYEEFKDSLKKEKQ